uniref:Uncharacterized protein n=1 Tax=Romanomermis culicivorax TaxID=13658 RepID=A0A915J5K5_ROMCU
MTNITVQKLLISSGDGSTCPTLSGNGCSHCGDLSDHCSSHRYGIHGDREGRHGHQIEWSVNCMSSGRGWQHRDGWKRMNTFAYATGTAS